MKLIKSASRWGSGYTFRYFLDGKRISREAFDLYCVKPECGDMENTDFGFRKVWR